LKKQGLVVDALFPKPTAPVDEPLDAATRYIRKTTKSIRDAELALLKKKKGKAVTNEYKANEPKSLKIYAATKFPEWQEACLLALKENYNNGAFDDAKVREVLGAQGVLKNKKAMPFVQEQKKIITREGPEAFNRTLIFDEVEALELAKEELKRTLGFHTITILGHEKWTEEDKAAENAVPGVPTFSIKNEPSA
jgi:leucyl-tRNA synthetase